VLDDLGEGLEALGEGLAEPHAEDGAEAALDASVPDGGVEACAEGLACDAPECAVEDLGEGLGVGVRRDLHPFFVPLEAGYLCNQSSHHVGEAPLCIGLRADAEGQGVRGSLHIPVELPEFQAGLAEPRL